MIRVKNWEKFQRVRRRGAEYVLLHTRVTYDAEFLALGRAAGYVLMLCWCVAGQTRNELPDDPSVLLGHCGLAATRDNRRAIQHLIKTGWLYRDGPTSDQHRTEFGPTSDGVRTDVGQDLFDSANKINDLQIADPRKSKRESKRESKNYIEANASDEKTDNWLAPTAALWTKRFGAGTFNGGKIGKALLPLKGHHDPATIAVHVAQYLDETEARFHNWPRFTETFLSWAHKPLVKNGVMTAYGEKVCRDAVAGR